MRFYSKIAFILALFAFLIWIIEVKGISLCINSSASLPQTLFFSYPSKEISRGDYIAFNHPNFPKTLAKQVVGLPGDSIEIQENQILVNGTAYGAIQKQSSSGKIYHPTTFSRVPKGHFFVIGHHHQSFDSRYEEFGCIFRTCVTNVIFPIF